MSTPKWMVVVFSLVVAALAAFGEDFIESDLKSGGTVSELRQQHLECLAVSQKEFYARCAELNGFKNTDAAYRKLRPGKIKLPVAVKITPAEELEVATTPTAVLPAAEEKVETKPAAPVSPSEEATSAGQVELAKILFDPDPLQNVDWDQNFLLSKNETLTINLAKTESDVAKMEKTITGLQNQLQTAENKPAEIVSIPIKVEVPREQNFFEVVAEPVSATATGMLLAIILLCYFNQQYRRMVSDLADRLAVAERSINYWRNRAKGAENKTTFQDWAAMENKIARLEKIRDRYIYTFKLPGMRKGIDLEKADVDDSGNTLTVRIAGVDKPVPVEFIEDVLRINPDLLERLEEEGIVLPEPITDPAVTKMRQERARQLVA